MLSFKKKDLVKILPFAMFILLVVLKQNTYTELEKTRNIIGEQGDKHELLKFKHAAGRVIWKIHV